MYFAAVEKDIYEDFSRLYSGFAGGAFGQEEYLRKYDKAAVKYVHSIEKAVESLKF